MGAPRCYDRPMPEVDRAELSDLLEKLVAGSPATQDRVTLLSDLDREQARSLRTSWKDIPRETREAIITEAVYLADDSVDHEFTVLAHTALDDPDPEIRRIAVEALREATDRTSARRLMTAMLDDPDRDVAAAAAQMLGTFVLNWELQKFNRDLGNEIVEALRQVVVDEGRPVLVRANAIEALGYASLPWVDGLIMDAYFSDERDLRLAAVHAMGASASERWLEYLFEQLNATDALFRLEAVIACGEIASEDAIDPVAERLYDDDEEIVRSAINALGEIGGSIAAERLRDFAEEAPLMYRADLRAAIEATVMTLHPEDAEEDL